MFGPRIAATALALTSVIGVTAGPAGAAVAATWGATKTLQGVFMVSSPPEAPSVAANSSGHAVAVWDNTGVVRFAEHDKATGWSSSRPVYAGAAWYGGPASVAIGSDGTTAIAWATVATRYVPAKLVASVRAPEGTFTLPVQPAPGVLGGSYSLGVAGDGSVTMLWAGASGVQSSTRSPAGFWSPAQQLSAGTGVSLPRLVVNDSGAALAVWQQGAPGIPTEVVAAYRPAGSGSFDPAATVSAGTGKATWNPQPTIDATGDVAVGFVEGTSMVVSERPPSGAWTTPVTISPALQSVGAPALAMDDAGDLVAAWQAIDASGLSSVWESGKPAGGTFGNPLRLSVKADDATGPSASYSGDGTVAAVTWIDNAALRGKASTGTVGGIWTRSSLGLGYWGSTVPVAAGGGTAAAVWAAAIPTNANTSKIVGRAFG